MFNHHIPPSFLWELGTGTTTTGMNKYVRKMSVTYDTYDFRVFAMSVISFTIKKEFFISLENFE
jgi:hypothetical protein